MPQRLAHLAVFSGAYDPALEQTVYRLLFACGALPRPGDVVTTAHVDATCAGCRAVKWPTQNTRTDLPSGYGDPSV